MFLGIDIGSISAKVALVLPDGRTIGSDWRRTNGRPGESIAQALAALLKAAGDVEVEGAAATGSGRAVVADALGLPVLNETLAHATAAWTLHPGVASVVDIGGQDSKFLRIGRDEAGLPFLEDHRFNDLCAAGTGAFLDQMSARLGLDIEAFASLAAGAPRAARVAGRCAVFARTDLIHLRQRGCPLDEMAFGLCTALVRTFIATLCGGRAPAVPVLIQGGVARNGGVVRAFRETIGGGEGAVVLPEEPNVMGAIGAALFATKRPFEPPRRLSAIVAAAAAIRPALPEPSSLSPLAGAPSRPLDVAARRTVGVADACLGLDVGSAATKVAILGPDDFLLASANIPTAGDPVGAVCEALRRAGEGLPTGVRIARAVATGSGRALAREVCGADGTVDEISAQANAAVAALPEADTVFEIGGQDAKYVRLSGGRVARFQMNRACAAGTGAFIEEQAGRLGIDLRADFARLALAAKNPSSLGTRCTVFMDSDLVHHVQQGASTEDLSAGLAYAVARNYLDKVVGSRPIGRAVVFQGGVARNDAVVAAFRRLLPDRQIVVHPHADLSGAIGAARIAREGLAAAPGKRSSFRGFRLDRAGFPVSSFECGVCENRCEIRKVESGSGRPAFFGSVCGRFEQGESRPVAASDPFEARERLRQARTIPADGSPGRRGSIGLPDALSMRDYLPFWRTFLESLGFAIETSGPTDRAMSAAGAAIVPAEFCQPVKVLFGHVQALIARGIRRIFVPHLRTFVPAGESRERYACPYTQAVPYVVRSALVSGPDAPEVVSLEYPVTGEDGYWIDVASRTLGADRHEVLAALASARSAQSAFRSGCREEGARVLAGLSASGRKGAVLLGRPYNTSDRCMNLNLARRLAALDLVPVPFDFLPLETARLPDFWGRVRWGYGREQLLAARLVRDDPRLVAVVVTNFGCGPDSFIDQYLEDELADTPNLVLEFDDHQAEAGLDTRLEAFARTFGVPEGRFDACGRTERHRGTPPGEPTRPLREFTYWIPDFSDHSRAFTGALRSAGCRAVLAPPSCAESWELGLRHAYGRECHPYVSFLGDIVFASQRPDFVPNEVAWYVPSYFGPCLLPQYMVALKLVLDRIGLRDVCLLNVADPPTMAPLGKAYAARLAAGIYAIDRLFKWKTEILPYERDPGSVLAAYGEGLDGIEQGLAEGGFRRAVKRAVEALRDVALAPDAGSRQRIGIVGDVYTRVNVHANDHLYDRLQGLGFEVWTSCTVMDVSLVGVEQLSAELARQGRAGASFAARGLVPLVAGLRWSIDRLFPADIRTPQERQFPRIHAAAERYASHWIDKALSLNLSRVEEFHQAGAHGVVNVMCHGCMLGMVTSALLPDLRRDAEGMPLMSLVYEGLQSTHTVNRLEAFADRVRQRAKGEGRATNVERPPQETT